MSSLSISLFGSFRISRDNRSLDLKVPRAALALLAYLLVYHQRSHPRDILAGLFWGDHAQERARSCLNTALWRLRSALEAGDVGRGTYLITTPMGDVGFNQESDHWLDVAVFESQISRASAQSPSAMSAANAQELEHTLQLYNGELLEGFYEDWALRERERLRGLYLSGLKCLMGYYKHIGAYEQSLKCGQQILSHDPLREEIHREMIRLYVDNGQRALAVHQYQICRQALVQELGIAPMEETQALHAQIVTAGAHWMTEVRTSDQMINLQQIRGQLSDLLQEVDQTREQLVRILQMVENLDCIQASNGPISPFHTKTDL